MPVPDFRHAHPDRGEINDTNVVLDDIVDAITKYVLLHLNQYEETGESRYAGLLITNGLDRVIRNTELLKRRIRDYRAAENRKIRGLK